MKNGFVVYNTFINKVLSRHKTLEAAVAAEVKEQRAFNRVYGRGSGFVNPTAVKQLVDGEVVSLSEDLADRYSAEYGDQMYANTY